MLFYLHFIVGAVADTDWQRVGGHQCARHWISGCCQPKLPHHRLIAALAH